MDGVIENNVYSICYEGQNWILGQYVNIWECYKFSTVYQHFIPPPSHTRADILRIIYFILFSTFRIVLSINKVVQAQWMKGLRGGNFSTFTRMLLCVWSIYRHYIPYIWLIFCHKPLSVAHKREKAIVLPSNPKILLFRVNIILWVEVWHRPKRFINTLIRLNRD